LLAWIQTEEDDDTITDLTKKTVPKVLANTSSELVTRVLELRQELAKTSISKYHAMLRAVCDDDCLRGLTQHYGANRTGRWCLAEGSQVLVKSPDGRVFEKPIEQVTVADLVWDGADWVEHEGVVFSGDKEVITWDGVTATPEHYVWVSGTEKVTLRQAAEQGLLLWRGEHVPDL
jgi:hypothetical protein